MPEEIVICTYCGAEVLKSEAEVVGQEVGGNDAYWCGKCEQEEE